MSNPQVAPGMQRRTLLLAALVLGVAVTALVSYRLGRQSPPDMHPVPSQPEGVSTKASQVTLGRTALNPSNAPPREQPVLSPELLAQVMRERATELDANFRKDPVSFGWAGPMEAKINKIIGESGYLGEKDYGITAHSVECRTHGCSISVTFPNDELSEDATMFIRREVAGDFNQALSVPLSHPDGSIEYRIYAVSPGNAGMLAKAHQTTTQSQDSQRPSR
jgi:hypothetical protein